jgi:hypothetical protein
MLASALKIRISILKGESKSKTLKFNLKRPLRKFIILIVEFIMSQTKVVASLMILACQMDSLF